jgi:very-short-patch-repair endonuclease
LVRAAGLPQPLTQQHLNGFRVDFYWPELRLVVETDSLRYHRTPSQQTRDRQRDQAHTLAGLTPLRFTHAQIAFEPRPVVAFLRSVAERQRLLLLGASMP